MNDVSGGPTAMPLRCVKKPCVTALNGSSLTFPPMVTGECPRLDAVILRIDVRIYGGPSFELTGVGQAL